MSFLLLVSVSLFLSCNKVDLASSILPHASCYAEPGTKLISTVNGFVTNENNQTVAGA